MSNKLLDNAKAISFTAEMAEQVMLGNKTQTRRPQTGKAKYKVGDILWVREPARIYSRNDNLVCIKYAADEGMAVMYYPERLKWNPIPGHKIPNGIFKEAARTFLRVTDVRAERVQDMTPADADAEGMAEIEVIDTADYCRIANKYKLCIEDSRVTFIQVWDAIYGETEYRWDNDPDVWVYEFERVEG